MKNSLSTIYERRERILTYINNRQEVTVEELAQFMHVTTVTIRKDLDALSEDKKIERCFGGAKRLASKISVEKKRSLANAAAGLLTHDDVVLINSSTTASYVVEYVGEQPVTIISNNTNLLSRKISPNTILIMTGGQLLPGRTSLSGVYAVDILSRNRASKCIIGVRGISLSVGITSPVLEESTVNRLMVTQTTGSVIAIASSDKIGRIDSFHVCSLDLIDVLVTDEGIHPEDKKAFENVGLTVIIAKELPI